MSGKFNINRAYYGKPTPYLYEAKEISEVIREERQIKGLTEAGVKKWLADAGTWIQDAESYFARQYNRPEIREVLRAKGLAEAEVQEWMEGVEAMLQKCGLDAARQDLQDGKETAVRSWEG